MIGIIQANLIKLKFKIIYSKYMYCVEKMFSFKSTSCLDNLYSKSKSSLYTSKFEPNNFSDKFNGFIPINELNITYSCSTGPGGQNVNKVNTKVDVRFNVKNASWLNEEIKQKIIQKFQNKINKDGYLIVKSDMTRSQQLNLADALQKLRKMIRDLIFIPYPPSLYTLEKHRKRKLKSIQERVFSKRITSAVLVYRKGLCK